MYNIVCLRVIIDKLASMVTHDCNECLRAGRFGDSTSGGCDNGSLVETLNWGLH